MSNATASTPTVGADKGRKFTGIWSGKGYLILTKIFGFTRPFYERALGDLDVDGVAAALDVGCGPGVLAATLAGRLSFGAVVHGIDLSEDQIVYARVHAAGAPAVTKYVVGSMDELPFVDASLDLVVSSMALHEAAREVRPNAIREIARALKPGGRFLLVDWSKPRFGLQALIWLPFLLPGRAESDNWNNTYRRQCEDNGMELIEDSYINSITRRQLFRKR